MISLKKTQEFINFTKINFIFRQNTDWLWNNYPPEQRYSSLIFEAEDVLVPEVIQVWTNRFKIYGLSLCNFGP